MKYERFEDLPVWKAAIELAVQIFALTENEMFRGKGDIRNQLDRAAVSVSNNIAEGFERGTTPELLTFSLHRSWFRRGSSLNVAFVGSAAAVFKSQISDFKFENAG